MTNDIDHPFLIARDGIKISYIDRNLADPQSVVCVWHGLGEDAESYEKMSDELNQEGIACILFNLRGHGQSEGNRGHIPSMDQVLSDIEEGLKLARKQYLDTPLFLLGHQFGGTAVINYMLSKPTQELKGFITSSSIFSPMPLHSAWDKWKVLLFSHLWPKLLIHVNSINPLQMSIRCYEELKRAAMYCMDRADSITLPGLIVGDEEISKSDFLKSVEGDYARDETVSSIAKWIDSIDS